VLPPHIEFRTWVTAPGLMILTGIPAAWLRKTQQPLLENGGFFTVQMAALTETNDEG
jgi:hypothetical protein